MNIRKVYGLVLAGSLIVGAPWAITNALFSDTATVEANTFETGSVEISTSPASAVVSYSNMAPGDSDTSPMVVSNDGSLEQRYSVTSSATDADSKELKDQLALVIKTIDDDADVPCDEFDGTQVYSGDLDGSGGEIIGSSTAGAQSGDRDLAAAGDETLCFKVSLPGSTGNAYQGAATTATFTFEAEQTANNS